MNETKTFTVADFIDAIELNGYRQARGEWIQMTKDKTKVIRACAMGQGIINLGLERDSFQNKFNHIYFQASSLWEQSFTSYVMMLNDDKRLKIPEIVRLLRERFKDELNTEVTVKTHQWIKEK